MKGYKVFNSDWTCRGYQYEVGKKYEMEGIISVCNNGFHFCEKAVNCFDYYNFDSNNKVAEICAYGICLVEGNKSCTNKIEIIREIPWVELLEIVNTGDRNTGNRNTGDRNTGNRNTGNRNTGNWNTGHWNIGDSNTGDSNTGDSNTGNSNIGDSNTGHSNTGDSNTGNWNTGHWNIGNWNTGDSNVSDFNTGCFCTEDHKIKFFDAETDMTLGEWHNSDAYYIMRRIDTMPVKWIGEDAMSDQEKKYHPSYETTGGYLKKCDISKAYIEWWDTLTEVEQGIIKAIPNFDAKKFELITGIKVEI